MIKKKVFIITILGLLVVIVVQAAIILKPAIIGRHEVTTPENAIILAKAAILQRYGEEEIQKEFFASIDGKSLTNYWYVGEPNWLDDAPHVLVRCSDGKVILKWDT